jgi:small subunit ribosomal protein S1
MEDKEKNIEETNSIENQEIKNEVEQVNEPEKKEETTEETTEEKAEAVEEKAEVVVEEKEEKNEVVEEKKASKKIELREESFDWDNYDKEQTTLSTIAENEVVDGTVIFMNKREVVINIGYKSEGVVSLNEFRYNPELKVGDTVEVYVESQEDKKGQLVLSHKKARALRSWDRVNEALDKDEIIKGYIKCRTKGGMIVDVFGIEAFLPGSQIDVKPIRDYDVYVGKTMEFKVVKINHEFKNVVVSHKALIEAELEQQKKDIISKLEKGQVLEGTLKTLLLTVYSSTLVVLTDLFILPTFLGVELITQKKLYN